MLNMLSQENEGPGVRIVDKMSKVKRFKKVCRQFADVLGVTPRPHSFMPMCTGVMSLYTFLCCNVLVLHVTMWRVGSMSPYVTCYNVEGWKCVTYFTMFQCYNVTCYNVEGWKHVALCYNVTMLQCYMLQCRGLGACRHMLQCYWHADLKGCVRLALYLRFYE